MNSKYSMPEFMTLVGYAVAVLFVVFGLYILFSPQMINVPPEFRTIFGVTVIGYGLFRSVIIFQKSKRRKNTENESDL